MLWLRLVFAFALPTLCGFIIIAWAYNCRIKELLLEKAVLGFGFGFGLLSIESFLLGFSDLPLTFPYMALAQVVFAMPFLIAVYLRRGQASAHKEKKAFDRPGKWEIAVISALALWICLKIVFVLYSGFNKPFTSFDFWTQWGAGGKLFFYAHGLILDSADENFFGRGYRIYMGHPLLTTMTQVWISNVLGGYHETFAKSWSSVYFLSLLLFFMLAIKKEGGFMVAIVATFFLSTLPLLTFHAQDGYADLTLSFYVLAGAVFLWWYMEKGTSRFLMLSGLFMAMAAFTKNEGLLYLFFTGVSLVFYILLEKRGRWMDIVRFALPALIFISPWIIFKAYYAIGSGHGYETSSLDWSPALHFEIIPIYFKEIFFSVNHGLVFPFLFVISIMGVKVILKSNIKYLYLLLILFLGALLFLYITTWDFTSVVYGTGLHRNTLTFVPLAFFLSIIIFLRLGKISA
ncbi:MAG: hypothetical protein HY880_08620 [Deltaproteobacteria bacterium]|nr:hypothetical protein [Deltaproteobacteria bacterium]